MSQHVLLMFISTLTVYACFEKRILFHAKIIFLCVSIVKGVVRMGATTFSITTFSIMTLETDTVMLSVTYKTFVLSVVMLNVAAPKNDVKKPRIK